MFDDVYKQIDESLNEANISNMLGDTGISKGIADILNKSIAGVQGLNIDTQHGGGTLGVKMESFNVNNYYSIRFNNTMEVPYRVKVFNQYESNQYEKAIEIFKSDKRHMSKLISLIAFAYADEIMEDIISKKRKLASEGEYNNPITRENPPSVENLQSLAIFNLYGDEGYKVYMSAVKRLLGNITLDNDGRIQTNDAVFANIVKSDEYIPYVWLDTSGEYYLLKPYEAVTAMRNAFKSAVSSKNPQGVTIHELIDGKFSVKVVTPEKGAFINKIKDPTSNKKFDFKSQNQTALKQFHDDILEIFGISQEGGSFKLRETSTIMYVSQENFDRIVKSSPIDKTGEFISNRFKSAKGHLI